jgi:phosphonate transport system substrate-binding protein
MIYRWRQKRLLFFAAGITGLFGLINLLRFSIVCLGMASAVNTVAATTPTYTFGVVPQYDAQRIFETWQPILREIEKLTGLKFKLTGSLTIPAFETQFMVGEFDFAYMNPYHALKAAEKQHYIPQVRDVGRSLYGIIVVRKDSPITTVQDLEGKTVAFPAPNALGASLIPRADLKNLYNINILPRYVQSHSSVYLNVALGRVAAGGGLQKTFGQQKKSIRNKLRILYKTREVATHPIVAHERVPEEDRKKVKLAFLSLANTQKGRMLLSKVPIVKLGPATLKDYLPLKTLALESFYVKE